MSSISVERLSAFQFRNFRLYWLGHLISLCGTWMQAAAQGWLVLDITNSSFYLGVVTAAGSLPILVFTLFGGVLADRFSKRSLLLFTQGLSILPALGLGFLAWRGNVGVWQVITLAGLLGLVNSLDIPVRQSFLIDLVSPESLHNAIALNSAAFNGARMIGPAIGGLLIGWVGIAACFWFNAASFGASLLALYFMRLDEGGERRGRHTGSVVENLREGFSYLKNDRYVFSMMTLVSVLSLLGLPYSTLIPVFARDILGLGSGGYGMLMSAVGLGALTGALWLSFREANGSRTLISAAGIFFSLAMIALSQSANTALSMALLFMSGASAVVVISSINIAIQTRVPDHLRGRVMSIYTALFLGTFPVGALLIGGVSHFIGVTNAVLASGVICLAVVSLIFIRARRLS
ncbi:MAG: MFS transporter [Nitrospirae bacterium]|nr:MFS transporter [Nitrospirota bacterium]